MKKSLKKAISLVMCLVMVVLCGLSSFAVNDDSYYGDEEYVKDGLTYILYEMNYDGYDAGIFARVTGIVPDYKKSSITVPREINGYSVDTVVLRDNEYIKTLYLNAQDLDLYIELPNLEEIIVNNNGSYETSDGVLYSYGSIVCYPPAKTSVDYVLPKNICHEFDFKHDGGLSENPYLKTLYVPSSVNVNNLNMDVSIDNIVFKEGNPEYYSKDGCVYDIKTDELVFKGKLDDKCYYIDNDKTYRIGRDAVVSKSSLSAYKINSFDIDSDNENYGYSGNILYDKKTGEMLYVVKNAMLVTIPASVNKIDFNMLKDVKNIYVVSENKNYGYGGNVLYDKKTGEVLFVTKGDVTATIPPSVSKIDFNKLKGVKEINVKTLYIPASVKVENLNKNVKIDNIVFGEGNSDYYSKNGCVYKKWTDELVFEGKGDNNCYFIDDHKTYRIGYDAVVSRSSLKNYVINGFNIDSDNKNYGYNGSILYDKKTGEILYVVKNAATITIPAAVTDLKAIENMKFEKIDVAADNKTFKSNGTVVYKKSDGSAVMVAAKAEKIIIPPDLKKIDQKLLSDIKVKDNVLFSKDKKTLEFYLADESKKTYTVPEGTEVISKNAINDAVLEDIYIPDSVTTIEEGNFKDCKDITIHASDYCKCAKEYAENNGLKFKNESNIFVIIWNWFKGLFN